MTLSPGSRLGSHEVVGLLGAGGMGEVYRAVDTRLNRQVAIKVLPELHADDPERLARFHREAQAVAALNHRGIAAIYELAESGTTRYLVLELIEGDTLADRLRRGPLPVEEALELARQILEALEAAHERGICHRDLKPANIKLTSDGIVKVLDFGLAKFLQTGSAPGHLSNSPTFSLAGTVQGVILGTAAYMSPEQAKGYEADQRSDIFSFGCILYELLTGRQAFDGESMSEVLASVLKSDVDLSALPRRLNPRLLELLRRCLEKNPKKRWHAAADVRVELESLIGRGLATDEPATEPAARSRPLWKRAAVPAAVAVAAAAVAGSLAWIFKPDPPVAIARFVIELPEGVTFSNTGRRVIDVSPDGTKIVYVAGPRLQLRELSALQPRDLAGTESAGGVGSPTFSPDGESLAFVTQGGGRFQLKRISVAGGAAVTLAEINGNFGVTWDEHGIIVGQGLRGIIRISPSGGAPGVLLEAGADEMLGSPQLLPGGRVLLYTVKKASDSWDKAQIAVQRLDGGQRQVLIDGGTDGRYLQTGHLVYALSGVLLAVRFDPDRLTLTGGPVPVVEGVRRAISSGASGSGQMGISRTGALVYVPGPVVAEAATSALAVFDRKGGNEPLKLPAGSYRAPRVSPDGRLVAFETADDKEPAIWVYELSGATAMRRLTFGGRNVAATWSPDGQWIAFQSDREGDLAIYRQRADGSGAAERLTKPEPGTEHIPQDWSRDGAHMLLTIRKDREFTLATMTLKDGRIEAFSNARSPAMINAVFSPDGRWIAHQARVEDRLAVFVEPFPATGAKYMLPQVGGHPTWSPKGNEIVINAAPQQSAIVTVTTRPSFGFGPPAEFARAARIEPNPSTDRRAIDFMPDGQRLIGVLAPGQTGGVVNNQFIVVLNWFEELKDRVGVAH